ncbi:hypothetical protein [Vibrio aestuarianus]|uniref:Uncharacterized protein n=1 Tax=Vibrio aestuarianus TaxID=28171 RepID=A0ABN8TRJ3_9VIBR|nr:hypothetical protein [Vibrio aestuarianus]EHH0684975.1 hypothetical protein [Vibrio vulnificus]EHV9037636.1 hypothetical protein [Vibrio vulnificus]EIA1304935.1 hypothetical protein [Vibrio vulnificus]EIT7122163.1 hypothetical protein [Vibrio vulnificus]EIV8483526.1 hypothetical protein [Vibrio vulnificus]
MLKNKYALILGLAMASPVHAAQNVDKAVEFLEKACVTKGSSFEIKAAADGSIKVKNLLNSGVKGSVSLSKKELVGFADAASELSANQASEMRTCMKPYIDQILSVLLNPELSGNAKEVKINTEGQYFKTEEFDKVMLELSSSPNAWHTPEYISTAIEMHPVKVKGYFNIASTNGLGKYMFPNDSTSQLQLTDKGVTYVLNRGLAN